MARVNRLEKGLVVLINKDENKICHNAKNYYLKVHKL